MNFKTRGLRRVRGSVRAGPARERPVSPEPQTPSPPVVETAPSPEARSPYQDVARAGEFEAIRRSGLFDFEFYDAGRRARNLPDLGLDPIEHYFSRGEALGLAPNPLFDPEYYKSRYPDVAGSGLLALIHYVNHGDAEGRVPHPLFDPTFLREQLGQGFGGNALAAYLGSRGPALRPHRLVDPEYIWQKQSMVAPADARPCLVFYLAREHGDVDPSPNFDNYSYKLLYPEIGALNPLYHFARYGSQQGYRATRPRNSLRGIAEQIDEAAGIDPDIVNPFGARAPLPVMELYDETRIEYLLSRRLTTRCGTRRFSHVVLAPWLKRGGAERVIVAWAEAILSRDAEAAVLILCTAGSDFAAASWLPYTHRIEVVFINDVMGDSDGMLVAFCNWLRFLECRYLYIVNSAFGWELASKCGRSLRPLVTTFAFVFCHDYDEFGRRVGYAWTHLRKALPWVDAFVSDNAAAIALFREEHFLDVDQIARFHCLYQPVDSALTGLAAHQVEVNLAAGVHRRHVVLWAARFDRQKGIELALEIARATPEADFLFFGGALEDMPGARLSLPENVSVRGAFDRFADLPFHEISLLLHTSHWEGLPNVLLEAGAAGLPIVATLVGGVGELIDEDTGWPLAHGADALAYRERITSLLADPVEALARSGRLSRRIAERHSREAFAIEVSKLMEGLAARDVAR